MIQPIKLRILQGDPIVHNVRGVTMPERFRGLPEIDARICPSDCRACVDSCPANAVTTGPTIDLGRCTFCPVCAEVCPEKKIRYTGNYRLTASRRDRLIVSQDTKEITPDKASKKIKSYFGRSLRLRQVSAGGCNGCELELNALGNVNFDMGRFGIDLVASPRHADGIVITGPVTKKMARPLEICFEAVPAPKIVILAGACAISGGIFADSPETDRAFFDNHTIDLFIPGCPPHPLTFITGLLDWLH
jgi:Ni,Fe-hydrogenase III small subunit/Pyruvate/2-oxoacid:ferredoxin oxidoreductase delta subunit